MQTPIVKNMKNISLRVKYSIFGIISSKLAVRKNNLFSKVLRNHWLFVNQACDFSHFLIQWHEYIYGSMNSFESFE